MGSGKILESFYVPESRPCSFSSTERLVGILGSIVEPAAAFLIGSFAIPAFRREDLKHFTFGSTARQR